jgi:biopolymer transport protein ExbD
MARVKRPDAFDVWFQAADTVYRGVPYGVVTGWAEQGRLAPDDKLRTANTEEPWVAAKAHPFVADFLFRQGRPPADADTYEQLQAVEMEVEPRKHPVDEDDDPDMIPLIDISLVLLVFFMMTTAVAALSPVEVPDMQHASELRKDADAFTIHIDKRADGEVFFALRIGEKNPLPEDNNLRTPEQALDRLMVRLREVQRPPEVRIACHKDLERGWVRDLARELDKLKAKEQIAFYGAEVNERKK